VEHLRSQIAVIQPRGNDGAGLLLSAAGRLGLGRHDAARRAFERDQIGHGPHVVSELAEAASRTGDVAPARAALEWLSQRTSVAQTDWVLGIETRVRALLSDGDAAERCYRVSIERLERTPVHAELARSHLLYGEWLRRGRRRADAREQLRTAHDVLEEMGIGPFAERARRELAATGKTACRRAIETSLEVTPRRRTSPGWPATACPTPRSAPGCSSAPRTIQYHLSKVFAKFAINLRSQLDRALPNDPPSPGPRSRTRSRKSTPVRRVPERLAQERLTAARMPGSCSAITGHSHCSVADMSGPSRGETFKGCGPVTQHGPGRDVRNLLTHAREAHYE
jgi:hypothetical protein